ncbi:POU domain, class 5, transcription factor 3-like [Callorhinchus milii]|uniref:POU domain, class 5, transcription factor 3-like n=1 Tax=Callorhinchus milii TaxID=7868 RepID=UPI001C3FF399|nr:POU domain, class 5, transcription factor 3-like [Callorhinchus milii]
MSGQSISPGQEGNMVRSLHSPERPHLLPFGTGVVQDSGSQFYKPGYNAIPTQYLFPFPHLKGEYGGHSEAQLGDSPGVSHWYPFSAVDPASHHGAGSGAHRHDSQLGGHGGLLAKSEIKTEKESKDYCGEAKYSSPVGPGPHYNHRWNPSFWQPGLTPCPPSSTSPTPQLPSQTYPGFGVFPSPPQVHPNPSLPTHSGHPSQSNTGSTGTASEEGHSSDSEEEYRTKGKMEEFAKELKRKRITLGFTQADVGIALGNLYGKMFSQTTICRFEALQLSFKNMCKLKPILERWLNDAQNHDGVHEICVTEQVTDQSRKRKRRTSIENSVKGNLETCFMKCPRPTSEEITQIAEDLNLEKDVIRVWFSNRRQKGKRMTIPCTEEGVESQEGSPLYMPPNTLILPDPMVTQGYNGTAVTPTPLYMSPFPQGLHPAVSMGNHPS